MGDFEDRLRAARAYNGELTQDEVAARIDPPVSQSTIKRVEAGRRLDEDEQRVWAARYARACELPIGFFFAPFEQLDERWAPAAVQLKGLQDTIDALTASNADLRAGNVRLEVSLTQVAERVDGLARLNEVLAQLLRDRHKPEAA